MATPAIRYNPIDLKPDIAVGVKLPFVSKRGSLFDLSYSTQEQLLSNLKNLILTRRGERILQPEFGTNLQDSLFEQNDELLQERITNSITSAINFWLPYVQIVKLDVQTVVATGVDKEEHGVTITLVVSLNSNSNARSEVPITFLVTPSTIATQD